MADEPRDAETPDELVAEAKKESVEKAEVTEEQQKHLDRWRELSEKAQGLLVSNTGLRQVVGAMLASRQLYAMALHDMDVKVEALDEDEVSKEQLQEIFISSAAKQAANPFDENELFEGVRETVLPWMEEVAKEHTALEARVKQDEFKAAEKERRETEISLGFEYMEDVVDLNRVRTLVLAGWKPAVLWAINHVLEYVTSPEAFATSMAPKQVVVLTREGGVHKDPRVLTIGEKAWENCAHSNDGWKRIFQDSYLDKLKYPLDLFVVTDLAHARTDHSFQSAGARAAGAQKRLRRWATQMGAAFVGGVLLDSKKLPDFNTPVWEQFRLFTYLRGVGVEVREDGDYDIVIGKFARFEGVPKEEVDAFASSNIITS